MTILVYVLFYGAFVAYAASAVAVTLYLVGRGDRALHMASLLAGGGSLALAVATCVKGVVIHSLPFTEVTDAFNLLIVFATVVGLGVALRDNVPALFCFYLPPIALLAFVNVFVGPFGEAMAPEGLNWVMMVSHVAPAFFAYALFLIASFTSIAYMYQVRRLKRMQLTGLFQRLPSLEQLDKILYKLIKAGYVVFTVTLLLGLSWAYFQGNLLNPEWFISPKIWRAVVMVVFYAVAFHSRQFGLLRGQKLAYVVAFGFTSLVLLYFGLTLLNLSNYNFWGQTA